MTFSQSFSQETLESGDLVFLGNGNSDLSKAISGVTQTDKRTTFSHMGMVEVDENGLWVIHASSKKGVSKDRIQEFVKTVEGAQTFVYRFHQAVKKDFSKQVTLGNNLLGSSYNSTYILEDDGFYCSELIYVLFEEDGLFELNPMTFKDSETDSFLPTWEKHYEELKIAIPEGKPGCNPNGMANQKDLIFLGVLKN